LAREAGHAVSLFFLYYKLLPPNQTLTKTAQGVKTTPAMASGLTGRVWTIQDVVGLMDPAVARSGDPRGTIHEGPGLLPPALPRWCEVAARSPADRCLSEEGHREEL
jgi:hypothetical protein